MNSISYNEIMLILVDQQLIVFTDFLTYLQPVGALNPTRREFYEERYASLAVKDTPARHYNTHYSTAGSTLDWLVRLVISLLHKVHSNVNHNATRR